MPVRTIVIGDGPAGVEAACAAASAGATVTLVSDSAIGGRAGWHSLLPSKVWLNSVNYLWESSHAPRQGIINLNRPTLDPYSILERINAVAESWSREQKSRLSDLSFDVVQGLASFVSDREVVIRNHNEEMPRQLRGDTFVVATGSAPRFPEAMRPDGKRILAPRFARQLGELPPDVVVIGAGATGTEFVSFFCLAGVKVIWVVDEYGVLPTFDAEASELLRRHFEHRGVQIVGPTTAERIVSEDQAAVVYTCLFLCGRLKGGIPYKLWMNRAILRESQKAQNNPVIPAPISTASGT